MVADLKEKQMQRPATARHEISGGPPLPRNAWSSPFTPAAETATVLAMKRFHLFSALTALGLVAVTFLNAQGNPRDSPQEDKSVVPPGKEERGLSIFTNKGCYSCHSAGTTKLPEVEPGPRLVIELGGDVHAAWTRDDYARAIMNPNHVVAEDYRIAMMRLGDHFKAENSPMPEFVDSLTVSDLIHLTTFLDSLSD